MKPMDDLMQQEQEPICDGCGGTIAQHTAMLNCRCDRTRYCKDWPYCNPPCHIGGKLIQPVGQLQEEAFGRGQVMWLQKPPDESMLYTADQMREYAKQAVEAEREACKLDISACVPRSGHKTPEWAMREHIFERINARR